MDRRGRRRQVEKTIPLSTRLWDYFAAAVIVDLPRTAKHASQQCVKVREHGMVREEMLEFVVVDVD
jgi:hypothetical protein